MTQKNDLIFVSIASYRDPELLPTLRDLFVKAKNPELLRVGICWQKSEDESIEEFLYNDNVRLYTCPWERSKGACWARHVIQKHLYDNEEYYFQLDSHHRFLQNWDAHLKVLHKEAENNHSKPIIGTYGTTYFPDKPDAPLLNEPYRIHLFDTFTEDGDIISRPQPIINHLDLKKNNTNLIPARCLSGHFIFAKGDFCKECIYDPNLYFRGEEITLSARAYTHGYDMFHPTYSIVWHEYLRKEKSKHWNDHVETNGFEINHEARNIRSKQRQRRLFGMDLSNLDFKHYGLGNKRSLHEYELYCGVDFMNRRVHRFAARLSDDHNEPEPFVMSEKEWDSGMLTKHHITVNWEFDQIPDNTAFDFWFFGFEDKEDKLLWRKDINQEDSFHLDFFHKKKNSHHVDFSAYGKIDHCVIIPHIRDGDWAEKIIIKV